MCNPQIHSHHPRLNSAGCGSTRHGVIRVLGEPGEYPGQSCLTTGDTPALTSINAATQKVEGTTPSLIMPHSRDGHKPVKNESEGTNQDQTTMSTIKFTLADKPSNSKGWARYSVAQDARRVIASNTGNQWVSSSKAGEAEEGSAIEITAQVMLIEGKKKEQNVYTEKTTLIVESGATAEIAFRPGSQGMRVTIEGARVA